MKCVLSVHNGQLAVLKSLICVVGTLFITLLLSKQHIPWLSIIGGIASRENEKVLGVKTKIDLFCFQCSGLLTSSHVHTGCLWFVWASEKDTRHFWIPDILWILQPLLYEWDRLNSTPVAECIAGHIQPERFACVCFACEGFFAHVCSLRNAVLFFTPAICGAFSLEVFSQSPFLTVMKRTQYELFARL